MMLKIYIDPGHGGSDPGAAANGLQEKNITLKIATRIRDILALEYEGLAVKLSRSTDSTVSLKARTDEANNWGANYFLSVHVNSGGGEGFESFIFTNTDSRTQEIQRIMHDAILESLQVRDRGAKTNNFHVLRESHMPAVLTEILFIDNAKDSDLLKSEEFLERAARGHVNGLERAFKLKRVQTQPEVDKVAEAAPRELYRVQVGAFKEKENAERLAKELTEKGFSAYIINK